MNGQIAYNLAPLEAIMLATGPKKGSTIVRGGGGVLNGVIPRRGREGVTIRVPRRVTTGLSVFFWRGTFSGATSRKKSNIGFGKRRGGTCLLQSLPLKPPVRISP